MFHGYSATAAWMAGLGDLKGLLQPENSDSKVRKVLGKPVAGSGTNKISTKPFSRAERRHRAIPS